MVSSVNKVEYVKVDPQLSVLKVPFLSVTQDHTAVSEAGLSFNGVYIFHLCVRAEDQVLLKN